jgi:hypothetical protein
MRSTLVDRSPVQKRRDWEAPVITELPVGTETRSAGATGLSLESGQRANPPPPATPAAKLGFAFEMSFPLSVRTE